jgi:Holliday junction DNA helicase RuvB
MKKKPTPVSESEEHDSEEKSEDNPKDNLNDNHKDKTREILNPLPEPPEINIEKALRPQSLEEFLGQSELKEKLSIFITAAKNRGESLDHTLFHGHPGLGKTTLARILSQEMGTGFKNTSGPVIERQGDLAALLTNLAPGDILFIDEIHRLSPVIEEFLYPAMEDFRLDIMTGQGPGARSIRLKLNPFTLVGATTRVGLLTPPLRERFGIQLRLDYYQPFELSQIVTRAAKLMNAELTPDGAIEIAKRSRGTPRIAGRILRRVRDFAEVRAKGIIDAVVADQALTLLEIDKSGLDQLDRRILLTICQKFMGGPVGLETLATSVGEEAETIAEVYEPYLIQEGYIHRSPRGRLATPKAYNHIGLTPPPLSPPSLFEALIENEEIK